MKEQQLRQLLQEQYGSIPPETHAAFLRALVPEKNARVAKKKVLYTPILAFVLVLALAAAAVAATSQVLDWYYSNRFTNVETAERDAVLEHVKLPLAQTQSENGDFDAVVQEISWQPEKQRLIVAMNVIPKDREIIELHSMWNLDADGSYVGGNAPEGETGGEDRGDHWLWTKKGFGPVYEMMLSPEKDLYLVDMPLASMAKMQSVDAFDMADGSVQFVLEYDLSEVSDAGSMFELTIPYSVVAYTEDDNALYKTGHREHWLRLTVDLGDNQ